MKRPSTFGMTLLTFGLVGALATAAGAQPPVDYNEPGIYEPVSSFLQGRDIRIPNSDQSVDGIEQSNAENVVIEKAFGGGVMSMTGHEITRISSPNDDMRSALKALAEAAEARDQAAMDAAAAELRDILLGTTTGRIYDGFSMLNWNRFKGSDFGAVGDELMPPDLDAGEYKMKTARDTGRTFESPFDGVQRKIWEVDINMLYYDGQIDSDTFLVRFPFGHDPDDVLHVNYRIFSLVEEDFSPTLVMLDRREAQNTVQFPFKGFDSVWIAFQPGEVLNVTVKYPPIRMIRGVYDWGWRVHPPRIQFMQPVYDIRNAHTGEIELDPQGKSFAYRNREDLTLGTISDAAPEMKMYRTVKAVLLDGVAAETIEKWLTKADQGPRGTWFEWADLAKDQRQLPDEAWDVLAAEEGLRRGEYGDFQLISAYVNNEMYGEGPFLDEIKTWVQREHFRVKLVNLDKHTHYFRNVDFSSRLHDDILRCCGGGQTSFEVMNFKPSYGAPKVAEVQWRAGWGFRPHYDVLQQQGVFPRGQDRAAISPYTGGFGGTFFGYQYSEEARGGDFRFNPPPFIIASEEDPSPFPLKDNDGNPGLLIGQHTEGYGVGKMCPEDGFPGFCTRNIAAFNPHGVLNFPPPPLRGRPVMPVDAGKFPGDVYPDAPVELRFPPFLRNPAQGDADAGDIIPPTGAWRPFLWINPANGTLFIDPDDHAKGYWADLTYSHGSPVFAGQTLTASIELPRASGQVFYQFDDLFHDNSIFSPHPVFAGFENDEEHDEVVHLRAFLQSFVRVRGRLAPLADGKFAEWVTLYDGPAGDNGCTGEVLASSPVDPEKGFFVFRCGNECASPLLAKALVLPGTKLCVQSTVGGFAETVIEP